MPASRLAPSALLAAGQQQGVAVRPGVRHELAPDVAARAGTVFHDDRLPVQLAQVLGQQAALDVGTAAGGEGHHDAPRAVGVVGLRLGGQRQRRARERQAQGAQRAAPGTVWIHGLSPIG
ncbi:hypothetical protein G6F59_017258 [Rhizopus arrhizus]|nr:hypothetical protein G6F59_017258 [Rhizopus arrhizus]